MELMVVALVPLALLVIGAAFLVVSQVAGFFQSLNYTSRQAQSNRFLSQAMEEIAVAQSQLYQHARDLENLSQKLQLSNQELARLNSMKSKFLSMVVHDMRTPLASIKGFGEMLGRQSVDDTQRKYVDYIVRGTDQINRLMSDLTDLAVIEAGKLKMDKASFQLSSLIRDVAPGISVIAKKNGVEFVYPDESKDVVVIGDKFRLGQALMNFLNNAVKFTPAGGKVELKAAVVGGRLTLAVKDTGPGIHPSERKLVFEKFYQSQFGDPKNRKKGWGLGLSIAQEIVRAHSGEIGVDSAGLGKGSTFWYRIPLKPPERLRLKALAAALAALLLPAAWCPARAQQSIPLEEKAKFEQSLEQRVSAVLLQLVGPSRYKVVVDATIDFTRVEKFDVNSGAAGDDKNMFLWQSLASAQTGGSELLPGIPNPESMVPGNTKSYEKQSSFPASFIKRLRVTVVLDRTVPVEQQTAIEKLVPAMLDMNPDRDVMEVMRADFAPAWKTIWYQPEAMSLLFKYGLIALMTLITLIVVATCFLKLAEAMDSMAQAQAHQLQMDFGQGQEGEGEEGKEGEAKKEGAEGEAEQGAKVYFNVKLGQIETLWEIMQRQDPENLALVAAHLEPDVQKAFLSRMPASLHTEVLVDLGKIRFVEADVVSQVKEELERRLESAVGGRGALLDLIKGADQRTKRGLLAMLEAREPELARAVRELVVLFEDLVSLEPREWSIVLGGVPLELWAVALYGADDAIQDAVKGQMLPKTWAIMTQMMEASKPTEDAAEASREKVVETIQHFIEEGRIAKPEPRRLGGAIAVEVEAERA
jgi:signal transduction histidine kinase